MVKADYIITDCKHSSMMERARGDQKDKRDDPICKKKKLKQTTRAYTRKNSKEILVSCIPCIRVFTTVQPKIQLPAFAIPVPRDKVQTYLMKTVKLIT